MSVLSEVKKHAARSCANFCGSSGCIREPEGSPLCTYYAEADHIGHRRCIWYERAVLPANETLDLRYWAEVTGDKAPAADALAKCRCGERFVRRSNRHKFCDRCAANSKRDSSRQSMRRSRQKSDAIVGN